MHHSNEQPAASPRAPILRDRVGEWMSPLEFRRATQRDEREIVELVHSEALNPFDLDWRRFVVATRGAGVLGAVQLRQHADGSRELASLVVRPEMRRRGIASRLIDAALACAPAQVFLISRVALAARYVRWGFRSIDPATAPVPVKRNYYLGLVLGGILALLSGRRRNPLTVLQRHTGAHGQSA